MRKDVLAGLSQKQRRRQERADALFVAKTKKIRRTALPEAMQIVSMTYAGSAVFSPTDFEPYDGHKLDVVICARLDLDHPLYYPDNLFDDCADCGCNLQYRPQGPKATRICMCCAARRIREKA